MIALASHDGRERFLRLSALAPRVVGPGSPARRASKARGSSVQRQVARRPSGSDVADFVV